MTAIVQLRAFSILVFLVIFVFFQDHLGLEREQVLGVPYEKKLKDTAQGAAEQHQEEASPTFNICRKSKFPRPCDWDCPVVSMQYMCNGTEYDKFGKALLEYMHHFTQNNTTPPLWGRRRAPLPPNKTILFYGNSHVKQVAMELYCHFEHTAIKYEYLKDPPMRGFSVTFDNNSTLYLVFNSPVQFSRDWVQSLARQMNDRPINTFDAIVLGQFNDIDYNYKDSKFYKGMMNWTYWDPTIDVDHVRPPDSFKIAQNYTSGPIIFVSSFQKALEGQAQQHVRRILQKNDTDKFRYILSRDYITNPFFKGHEGASIAMNELGPCSPTSGSGHRCVGQHGGYPTLVVYDVQELLFSMLN